MAVPGAPTALVATKGDTTVSIAFTQAAATPAVTNYKYNLDGGAFTALSPVDATSPVTITGLTNGTTYAIILRAVNSDGDSASSASVNATPSTTPAAPTSLVATAGDNQASIAFTAGATGGSAITSYQVRVNSGGYKTVAQTASPVIATGLPNNKVSTVYIRAVNANGAGAAASVTVTATDSNAANDNGYTDATWAANPGAAVPNLNYNDPDD